MKIKLVREDFKITISVKEFIFKTFVFLIFIGFTALTLLIHMWSLIDPYANELYSKLIIGSVLPNIFMIYASVWVGIKIAKIMIKLKIVDFIKNGLHKNRVKFKGKPGGLGKTNTGDNNSDKIRHDRKGESGKNAGIIGNLAKNKGMIDIDLFDYMKKITITIIILTVIIGLFYYIVYYPIYAGALL